MKISVIGLGKAGLPLAAVIADAGIKVIGVDIDGKKTDMINHGINPIPEEAGLSALVKTLLLVCLFVIFFFVGDILAERDV